jgi:hypothetical protein
MRYTRFPGELLYTCIKLRDKIFNIFPAATRPPERDQHEEEAAIESRR